MSVWATISTADGAAACARAASLHTPGTAAMAARTKVKVVVVLASVGLSYARRSTLSRHLIASLGAEAPGYRHCCQ